MFGVSRPWRRQRRTMIHHTACSTRRPAQRRHAHRTMSLGRPSWPAMSDDQRPRPARRRRRPGRRRRRGRRPARAGRSGTGPPSAACARRRGRRRSSAAHADSGAVHTGPSLTTISATTVTTTRNATSASRNPWAAWRPLWRARDVTSRSGRNGPRRSAGSPGRSGDAGVTVRAGMVRSSSSRPPVVPCPL